MICKKCTRQSGKVHCTFWRECHVKKIQRLACVHGVCPDLATQMLSEAAILQLIWRFTKLTTSTLCRRFSNVADSGAQVCARHGDVERPAEVENFVRSVPGLATNFHRCRLSTGWPHGLKHRTPVLPRRPAFFADCPAGGVPLAPVHLPFLPARSSLNTGSWQALLSSALHSPCMDCLAGPSCRFKHCEQGTAF